MHLAIFQMARFDLDFIKQNLAQIPKGALCLFPEYVLSPFFLELLHSDPQHSASQAHTRQTQLESLARQRGVHVLVPTLAFCDHKLYKQMAWISPQHTHYYLQQRLIAFDHWDEQAFFANPKEGFQTPLNFVLEGIKIAPLFGFEVHFDALWLKLQEIGVDMVLLSSASAFESFDRWRAVCSARAFCNSMLVRGLIASGWCAKSIIRVSNTICPGVSMGIVSSPCPMGRLATACRGKRGCCI
ncbi:carbon-nitrogen hydrolase family protein [Helicobacter vulpis]|uniref:carbon-nitrogen hydrolase family protein n=1 Tax=Helicobacter vulpis TaxID=2316076 RepID=UPI001F322563|nr:carbon-nitrogen hydrolase family protein [Helicobacter vulpis]